VSCSDWINECISGLIELYKTKDIYELYKCFNIKIIYVENNCILLQGNDAVYLRSCMNNEVVYIKDGLIFKYEKFVLAHELAHALLHTKIYYASFNKKLLNNDKYEAQANYFAFKLLEITIDPNRFKGYSITQISKILCVPQNILVQYLRFEKGGR
jgi:Zn-dependent peptidase ImmA (M78 family)